jgi:hypothetical protein
MKKNTKKVAKKKANRSSPFFNLLAGLNPAEFHYML